jgi:type II secretory pathway predicted ATPase ExeA
MFLDFYNLREEPFGVTPDPKYLYLSPTHREALASLIYGIKSGRGFMTLIAEPGMGKTTLLFSLLERLRNSARTAFLFHTQCNSLELLRHLLSDLGIDTGTHDAVELHQQLNKLLVSEAQAGRQVVAIIDEAQNLTDEVLESIRLLSDFETPSAKLIQIILSGQPLLGAKLASPSLTQLRQRLAVISHLDPLTPNEICRYIEHRASIAGSTGGELFDSEAGMLIAAASEGIPRNVNKLCFAALSLGCALRRKPVDGSVIREVIADFEISSVRARGLHARASRASISPTPEIDLVGQEARQPGPSEKSSPEAWSETAAADLHSDQEPAGVSQPTPSRVTAVASSPRRSFFGRRTPQAPARIKNTSEIQWERTERTAGTRAPSRELAGDLFRMEEEREKKGNKATHWELRAALISGMTVLLTYAGFRFIWMPIRASQPTASIFKQLDALESEVRADLQRAASSLSKDADRVVSGRQTDFPEIAGGRMTDSTEAGMVGTQTAGEKPNETAAAVLGPTSTTPSTNVVERHASERNTTTLSLQARRAAGRFPNHSLPIPAEPQTKEAETSPTHSAETMRMLKIMTRPPGAAVYIDGRSYGMSPTQVLLPTGSHTYRLNLAGYAPLQKSVKLDDENTETTVNWDFIGYEAGVATIRTVPPGADISIDGTPRGASPRTIRLTAGSHRLIISRAGYQPVSQNIIVPKNQTLVVSSTLSSLVTLHPGGQPPNQGGQAKSDPNSREDQE